MVNMCDYTKVSNVVLFHAISSITEVGVFTNLLLVSNLEIHYAVLIA